MWDIDTHDRKLPDSGRVISVPAHWVAGGTCWFILSPGAPVGPEDHEMGNDDWSGERGWSPGPAMPTDPNSQ